MSQSGDPGDSSLFTEIELASRWKDSVLEGFGPLEEGNIYQCIDVLRDTVNGIWNSDTVLEFKGDGKSTSFIIRGWLSIISDFLDRHENRRPPKGHDGKRLRFSLNEAVDSVENLSVEEKDAIKLSIKRHLVLLVNALLSLKVNDHVNVWAQEGGPVVDEARNKFQIWVGLIKTHLANLDRDMRKAWATEEIDFSIWLTTQLEEHEGSFITIQRPWFWGHREEQ